MNVTKTDFLSTARRTLRFVLTCLVVCLVLGAAACNSIRRRDNRPPASPAAVPVPAGNPEPVAAGTPVPTQGDRQLVVWLPEFSGTDDDNAGTLLASTFHQFEQANPGVSIDVQVKASSGQASLLNYLRSAQRVAPSILPDIVLLSTNSLWQIADLGLVQGLSALEFQSETEFYRFAVDAVRYHDQLFGIPYAASVTHLAHYQNPEKTPPETWTDLLAGEDVYLFRGSSVENQVNLDALVEYVGAGGQLLEDGSIHNVDALMAFFEFLVAARDRQVIPVVVVDFATSEGVWNAFIDTPNSLASVEVDHYLLHSETIPDLGYGWIPTRMGRPTTVATTWAFAILTRDETQRRLALALVQELLAPTVQGPWSQYARRLPTHASSLEVWSIPNDQTIFLNQQLESAVAIPNGLAFAEFARRMQTAQTGLLTGQMTPEEALQIVRIGDQQ